jgi:hypothetical protein
MPSSPKPRAATRPEDARFSAPCAIHTNAGMLDVLAPDPDKIRIEDIAHALSFLCRFNGHVRFHYSVAQHSILVAELAAARRGGELALGALLHDAAEAYLGDMISPLKALLPDFKRIESVVAKAIAKKFGFAHPEPQAIKDADLAVLAAEREQVIAPTDKTAWRELPPAPEGLLIRPMTSEAARALFLERFRLYSKP